jgi:diguanylate cyclase (GGDEF)-like protein
VTDVFESLREVDALLARRKFGRAAELLREAVAARPADSGLRLRLADALALDGQGPAAAELLEGVAAELAAQGFTAKAIAVLKRLQRLRPDAAELEQRLAELIRAQDEHRARPAGPGLIGVPSSRTPAPSAPAADAAPAPPEIPLGVRRSPLFSDFSRDELLAVIRSLRLHSFGPGQVLVSEGEPGDSLFVLASGEARVYVEAPDRRHREVRRLEAGDFFGEISLLTGGPRSATVVAAVECEVLELDRAAVLGIAARHPAVRATIERFCLARADSAEEQSARGSAAFRPAVEAESDEPGFHAELPAPMLTPAEIAALVPYCAVTTHAAGDPIFDRGDRGDRLYVIDEGEVEIRFEQRRPAKRLGPGEVFGELALLTSSHRRTASTAAATACRLISIDDASWRRLTGERPDLVVGLLEKSCAYLVESEQRLVHDLRRRNRELERALDFLHRTKQELSTAEALAQTDELTGIYNRRCFEEQMRSFVERSRDTGVTVALLLADVDRFKSVNDTHGHRVGDLVLTRMAQLLQSSVRWSDLPCRIGGDEFAILWTDLDPRGARRRARELQPLLSAFEVEGSPASLRVTASLGGAALAPGEGWEEFFARADRALYLSKRTGRGRLSWDQRLLDEEPITA